MAAIPKSTLIQGGRVMIFDSERTSNFLKLDVLIEGHIIAKVEPHIKVGPDTEIVDATGKIVCPGFVDTHRHLFQSHLRTVVANRSLVEYGGHLLFGRILYYTPEDIYLAQLGAATEAIYCGVTTVLDHSHVQLSEEHTKKCVKANIHSGLRVNYCFAPFDMPISLNPMKFSEKQEVVHQQQLDLFYKMAEQEPLGDGSNDGRVTLGLGYDVLLRWPLEETKKLIQFAHGRKMNITFHDNDGYGGGAMKFLRQNGLLCDTMVFSHFSKPDEDAFDAARDAGVGISSTPESEMQMSHGWPEAFRALRKGCKVGLGVDSSAICRGDLFNAMRLCLQTQRALDNQELASRGKYPRRLSATVDQVLYMATLGGAEAMHQESEIGSIEVGKRADIIVVRMDSPCTIASHDPAAALVLHVSPSDVDTVFVNGEVVKRNGTLLRVDWEKLKDQLLQSREKLEERWKDVDWDRNTEEGVKLRKLSDKLE